jgi:multiple antibiotic resistance protein
VTILLFSRAPQVADSLYLVAAVIVIYLLTYVALFSANRVKQVIGRTGDDILRRLLGVILAALSIQFITDGLRQILAG